MCQKRKMSANKQIQTIKGYIVPPKKGEKEVESDDEEDDGVDFPDFNEMSAIAGGASYLKNCRAKLKTVTLKSLDGRRSERCKGRLLLTEPWWLVTVSILKKRDVSDIRSVSYELRQDDMQKEHKLVTKFLLDTSRNHPLVEDFLDFLERNKMSDNMTFARLDEDLRKYMKQFPYEDDRRLQILSAIWTPRQGKIVRFAMMFPRLFNIASKLMPSRFLSLTDNVDRNLLSLEEATRTSIWELGFKQILGREYDLYGIEAEMPVWQSSTLIANVGPKFKDALYIYNALKLICKKEGHTYVMQARLKQNKKYFDGYTVTDWKKALEFLEANGVIVREVETQTGTDDSVKVYLASNFYAEVNAAGALAKVANVDIGPRYWEVDLASEDFAAIRTDEDQMKAVEQMNSSALTILSGKGGCGKTSVVTTLLSHACIKSFQRQHPNRSLKSLVEQPTQGPSVGEEVDKDTLNQHESENNGNQEKEDMYDGNQEIEDTFLSETPLGENILLTAPTGKAASVLGRKAKLKSCTLHSVIMSYKMHCERKKKKIKEDEAERFVTKFDGIGGACSLHDTAGGDPRLRMAMYLDAMATVSEGEAERSESSYEESDKEPRWTYSSKTILVVDECSLVSVNTFADMMNILMKETEIRKIILLGDVRQLPSIEPGYFMGDIFKVFSDRGLGLELRTNHRAESELIVNNATLISQRQDPEIDSKRRFSLIEPIDGSDNARDCAVKKLLDNVDELQDHTKSQFVTFTGKGVEAVNEMCCKHYTGVPQKQTGKKFKTLFKEGDKICLRKNGKVIHHYVRQIKKNKNEKKDGEWNVRNETEGKNIIESNRFVNQDTPEARRNTTHVSVKRQLLIDFGNPQTVADSNGGGVWSGTSGNRFMPDRHGDMNMSGNYADMVHLGYHGDGVHDHNGDTVETMEFSERGDELCRNVDMIPFEDFLRPADISPEGHQTNPRGAACYNHGGGPEQHGMDGSFDQKTKGKLSLRKDGSMSVRYRESQQYMEPESTFETISQSTASSPTVTASTLSPAKTSTSSATTSPAASTSTTASKSASASTSTSTSATSSASGAKATTAQIPETRRQGAPADVDVGDFSVRHLEKLCATRRCRAPREDVDSRTDKFRIEGQEIRLSNGEIFFIEKDFNYATSENKQTRYLYINDCDPEKPRRFCVDFKQVMSECKMRHAWTRTIHTFQGSESEVVVYILSNIFYENWQHVYTAITRGRKSVYIVGSKAALNQTICRPARKRNTSLQEKLVQKLMDHEVAKENKDKNRGEEENDQTKEDIDNFENSDGTWVHSISLDNTERNPEQMTMIKHFPMEPRPSTSAEDNSDFLDVTPNKSRSRHDATDKLPHGFGSLLTNKIICGPQQSNMIKSDLPSAKGKQSSSLMKRKSSETFENIETPKSSKTENQQRNKLQSDVPSLKGKQRSSLMKRKSSENVGNKETPPKSMKTDTSLSVTPVRLSIDGMSLDNQNSEDDFM